MRVTMIRPARRALPTAAACAALLIATYLAAAHTSAVPRFEQAVLRSAGGPGPVPRLAAGLLGAITSWSVTPTVAAVAALGWRRGGPPLGAVAAAVMLASIGTADLLHHVLPLTWGGGADRSFPSGHAAVATSVACTLLLVAPARHRDRTAVLASAAMSAVAALTVVARWHRPTDTIGSALITLAYASAATAFLARLGRIEVTPRTLGPRSPAVTALIAQASIAAAVAGTSFVVTLAGPPGSGRTAAAALVGGLAITAAAGAAIALATLALLGPAAPNVARQRPRQPPQEPPNRTRPRQLSADHQDGFANTPDRDA